jgi:hypothetical protein
MIDELARALRQDLDLRDNNTITELRTYVRDEKGRTGGSPFDDRVISLAIAVQMLNHVTDPQYEQKDVNAWDQLSYIIEEDQRRERERNAVGDVIGAHSWAEPSVRGR